MTLNYDKSLKGVYRVATTSSPLNLRTQPSTKAAILCEIPKNSHIICAGVYSGDFLAVYYSPDDNLLVGFCHKKYLKKEMTL